MQLYKVWFQLWSVLSLALMSHSFISLGKNSVGSN